MTVDAVGPETYTIEALVRLIAEKVQSRTRLVHVPPGLALLLARAMGYAVRDVLLTGDEMTALMSDLLVFQCPPTGQTRLSEWLDRNAAAVGARYASELDRHYRWAPP